MKRLIQFMESRKFLAVALSLVYYLLVVFPHNLVGKYVEKYLDIPLGRENYNLLIVVIASSIALLLIIYVIRSLKFLTPRVRTLVIILGILDLALIILALNTIIVINIELIHVMQYAIMAILLYPLFSNYRETLFWTLILGALDELYQYLVLAAHKSDYYDFNDVVINMLGAVLGLLILRSALVEQKKHYSNWIHSPASKAMLVMGGLFLIGWTSGYISISPADKGDDKVLFEFVRKHVPGFWRKVKRADPFHVMQPLEGFLIIIVLFNIFKNIGYNFAGKHLKS